MNQETVRNILDAQEQLASGLLGEYYVRQKEFLQILDNISKDKRDVILDYLGICVEIHLKLLEFLGEKK